MKHYLLLYGAIASVGLAACTPQTSTSALSSLALTPVTLDDTMAIAAEQSVYVPVYSYIYMRSQGQTINLTATLSIRNTDSAAPIIVASVDYYSSSGELIRTYLEQPVELPALSATEFVVEQEDIDGGLGTAFLIEWVAETRVSDPVIEAVMINTSGNQGISFISQGRVISPP